MGSVPAAGNRKNSGGCWGHYQREEQTKEKEQL